MTAPRALARVLPDKHETCAYTEFCYAFPIKEPVLVDNTASAHVSKKCPHAIRREGEGLHIRGDGYAVVAFSSGCRSESNGLHPKRIASRRHERFGYEAITLSRRERSRSHSLLIKSLVFRSRHRSHPASRSRMYLSPGLRVLMGTPPPAARAASLCVVAETSPVRRSPPFSLQRRACVVSPTCSPFSLDLMLSL